MGIILNNEIRIPIQQSVFHGSSIRLFFFFVAHAVFGVCKIGREVPVPPVRRRSEAEIKGGEWGV